ncbi:hypothetical protein PV326_014397 [Microctonus aethiopoides]|uniref:Uncharacterized protein n=1 Tax=Microctonus aethiopoides TaxID=144406 RepID=A0AA39FGR6_9HYME|nr:hypothetical protein PV326_014397 [Microctonus aethiopoides]KAK0169205.1 hypothetical protein PV328_012344 [Microctonus aethiopoides]
MESNPDLKKGSDEEEEVFNVPPEMGQSPTQLTRDDGASSLPAQKSSDVLNIPSQETPTAAEHQHLDHALNHQLNGHILNRPIWNIDS